MYLDDRAVQRNSLELDSHYLFPLQVFEYPVEHTVLGPAVHAGVDGVPFAESARQPSPLATLLGHVQDGIENLEVRYAYVASLDGQMGGDAFVLSFREFHTTMIKHLDPFV